MAGWVLQQCVNNNHGLSGFVTFKISNMMAYITNPLANLTSAFRKGFFPFQITLGLIPEKQEIRISSPFQLPLSFARHRRQVTMTQRFPGPLLSNSTGTP